MKHIVFSIFELIFLYIESEKQEIVKSGVKVILLLIRYHNVEKSRLFRFRKLYTLANLRTIFRN